MLETVLFPEQMLSDPSMSAMQKVAAPPNVGIF